MPSCLVSTYRHADSLPSVLFRQAIQSKLGIDPVFVSPSSVTHEANTRWDYLFLDANLNNLDDFKFDLGIIAPFDFDVSQTLIQEDTSRFNFYFEIMPRVRMSHQTYITKASVTIPFPFVKTPDLEDDRLGLDRPVKIFFPRLSSWNVEQFQKAVIGIRDSLLSVFDDLDIFEFILDIPPMPFETMSGEHITFADSDGEYITRMAHARVLISMGSIFHHEVGFCYSLVADSYRQDMVVGGELIFDPNRDPEEILTEIYDTDNFWNLIQKGKKDEMDRDRIGQTFCRFLYTHAKDLGGNSVWMFDRSLNFLRPMRPFKKSLIAEKHSFKQPKQDGSGDVELRDSYEVFLEKLEKASKMK